MSVDADVAELARQAFDRMSGPLRAPSANAHDVCGLYIAEQIVHAHDGSIRVESSPEAGTTFVVRWPRQRPR